MLLVAIHIDSLTDTRSRSNCFGSLAKIKFNRIKHLTLVDSAHVLQKFIFVMRHFLEDLNVLLPYNFLKRIHVKIKTMCKIKTELGCLFNSVTQIVVLQVIMKY